ncbi:type VI secretion system accessory protein TagJ [Paraburkholderia tropica]|uniref:Type VI secretion system protein ImpE n=1 Tax=Paraburkholderia tropica TaxID=92647 RepID=A0AAQ1GFS6_9BURK|nr:type VI secretion system accessory protein TagJ [Paraburkholderia tropica]RQN39303.1 ImpE/SciE family protein [Paraburkholderia tropica]SEJ70314.1 type VI secretion system protein ImpE [Paraburkholderia tropica]
MSQFQDTTDLTHLSELGEVTADQLIARVEVLIRKSPTNADLRWALFQWLCIVQSWGRAVQQLQIYAQLKGTDPPMVHVYRDLVRAERHRSSVLAGTTLPAFVFDDVEPWMRSLLDALALGARQEWSASDDARGKAIAAAPHIAGHSREHAFEWIADSDSRLGPVCEIITAGRYRWISMADISAWDVMPPVSLLDLIWAPCVVTLKDGTPMHGFMPARYPDSGRSADPGTFGLLLGRSTRWEESGRTMVRASGRKTWVTSAGDASVFELAHATFGASGTVAGVH